MNQRDKIKYFDDRRIALRKEITEAIIDLLKENNLTEIKLSQNPDEVPWVVWFNDENYGYDSRVKSVSLEGEGIAVDVYDEDCCCSSTLRSDDCDLACTNIDWLCKILSSINYTIRLPESAGITTIAGQNIEWSYDEPGLSELPEREHEFIAEMLKEGKTDGQLYHNDNDVEFEGTWKIKSKAMKELKDYKPEEFGTNRDEINSLIMEQASDCAVKRLEEVNNLPFEAFVEPGIEQGEEADEDTPTRYKEEYQDEYNQFYDEEYDRIATEIGFDFCAEDGVHKSQSE